jgi:hypothetical protein
MSTHRSPARTAVVTALVTGLAGAAVAGAAPAAAEPGRGDLTCAQLLERAAFWPGTVGLDGADHRLVSDAYVTHLSRSAPCAAAAG